MLSTKDEIQHAYACAYALHPDKNKEIASNIIIEAQEWLNTYPSLEGQKGSSLQKAVYHISEFWEKDQEGLEHKKFPIYKPTNRVLVTRYIKYLISEALDREPVFAAISLGCYLHQYKPNEVSRLNPVWDSDQNIRRKKKCINDWLYKRFCEVKKNKKSSKSWINELGRRLFEKKIIKTKKPTDCEEKIIRKSLSLFPLQGIEHAEPNVNVLEAHFSDLINVVPERQIHILQDYVCAGFPRLIQDYNKQFNEQENMYKLEDPNNNFQVPDFEDVFLDDDDSFDDQFNVSPLSEDAIEIINLKVKRKKERRSCYRGKPTKIRINGKEYSCDSLLQKSLIISLDAKYVEIFGKDDEGELLLFVLPLLQMTSGENAQTKERRFNYANSEAIKFISVISRNRDNIFKRILHVNYIEEQQLIVIKYAEYTNLIFLVIGEISNKIRSFWYYHKFAEKFTFKRFPFVPNIISIIIIIILNIICVGFYINSLSTKQISNKEENNTKFREYEANIKALQQENTLLQDNIVQLQSEIVASKQELASLENQNLNLEKKITQFRKKEKDYNTKLNNVADSDNKTLVFPKELYTLKNESQQLMGIDSNNLKAFTQYKPVRTFIQTNEPTFSWDKLEMATSYQVLVYDMNYNEVLNSGKVTSTKWQANHTLDFGKKYSWIVEAFNGDMRIGLTPLLPNPETKFIVLDERAIKKLKRNLLNVTNIYPDAHLKLGIIYAESGLLDEAEEQFKYFLKVNPDSNIAKKFLYEVESMRSKITQE